MGIVFAVGQLQWPIPGCTYLDKDGHVRVKRRFRHFIFVC
jgi:hypothetical protein